MPAPLLINDFSVENVFLGGEKFIEYGEYTNSTGAPVTITAGRLMGQVLATGAWLPQVSTAVDGSEMPRRIAFQTYTVADGDTVTIALFQRGEVNENKVLFGGADDWDTPVRLVTTGGGTIRSLLIANSGVVIVPSTELSGYDNS